MPTPRENLLALFAGEAGSWIPCCPHISNANNLPETVPEALLREPLDFLEISRFVGGDLLVEVGGVCGRHADDTLRQTAEQDGEDTVFTLETAVGTLHWRRRTTAVDAPVSGPLPEGHARPGPLRTPVNTEYPVRSPEDYRVLRHLYAGRRFVAEGDAAAAALGRIGEDGVALVGGGPGSPLYALVHEYVGLEQLIYHLADCPEEVEETLAVMEEADARWYEAACRLPPVLIRATDDLDIGLVSPDLFARYAEPALRRYAGICAAAGRKLVLHMCGHVRAFLPSLARTGVHAHHCLSSPPVGDTPIAEGQAAYGRRTVVMARNDPNVLLSGAEDAVEGMIHGLLADAEPGLPLLVIMPCGRAPLGNIRRAIAATQAFRPA